MKIARKRSLGKCTPVVILLTVLLLAGYIAGCCYAAFLGEFSILPLWDTGRVSDIPWLVWYSDYLFEQLLFLFVVFVFGLTFLGVAMIPTVLFFRGFSAGLLLLNTLNAKGILLYSVEWLYRMPSAIGFTVLILFSAYAFGVSLKNCRSTFGSAATVPSWKPYASYFFISLMTTAVSGVFYCILRFLFEALTLA